MATLEQVYAINNYGFQILNNSSLLRSGSLTNMYLIALKRKLPNKKVNAHRLPLNDFPWTDNRETPPLNLILVANKATKAVTDSTNTNSIGGTAAGQNSGAPSVGGAAPDGNSAAGGGSANGVTKEKKKKKEKTSLSDSSDDDSDTDSENSDSDSSESEAN